MRNSRTPVVAGSLLIVVSTIALIAAQETTDNRGSDRPKSKEANKIQLGNFSVSLAVKDIKASKAFYEKLDFKQIGGNAEQNWLIIQNGTTTIGLFQGMFDKNILTFNPGWNHKSEALKEFQDVRELQTIIKDRGIVPTTAADPASNGPASFVIVDPDGNPILIDQHVPKSR
jgi:catechol 2,3-dioxygenase-like lactoylglutathione lyase family enzyme